MSDTPMCEIPIDVYRRLRLLYLIEQFDVACFGSVRLHKTAYFSEKEQQVRVFTFRKARHGQYSEDLENTLEQLLTMDLVVAEPMESSQGKGNKYHAVKEGSVPCPHAQWLAAISADAKNAIEQAVQTYGYKKLPELLETAHTQDGFEDAAGFDVLLQANAPEYIPVSLSQEACDDLILALSPGFVMTLLDLSQAVKEFDFRRVRSD